MMESREEEVNREIFRTVTKLANLLRRLAGIQISNSYSGFLTSSYSRSGSAVLTNKSALSLTWTVYQNISKVE